MKYGSLLHHYQLKATPQRLAIIECMESAGHINIDDLFQQIREKFASISLATLYKNIHMMIKVNLIREVMIPGQKSKYEIEKRPHAHLLCKTCGELKDIPFDPTALLQESTNRSHYVTDDVSIIISGVCPNCQKQ